MIQQQGLRGYGSLVGVVEELRAGKLTNSDDIIGKLHLFGNSRKGWNRREGKYKNPNEIGIRIELLMDFARLPVTAAEYEAFSEESKQIREKSLQSIFALVDTMCEWPELNLINYMTQETFLRLAVFYGKVENVPEHEKQAKTVYAFFERVYYLDGEKNKVPYWYSKPDWPRIRQSMLDALIATSIASDENNSLAGILCARLPDLDLVDFLKRVDYYARGTFRFANPDKQFDGPQYPDQDYIEIIGLEDFANFGRSKRFPRQIVQNAALLALETQKRIEEQEKKEKK